MKIKDVAVTTDLRTNIKILSETFNLRVLSSGKFYGISCSSTSISIQANIDIFGRCMLIHGTECLTCIVALDNSGYSIYGNTKDIQNLKIISYSLA